MANSLESHKLLELVKTWFFKIFNTRCRTSCNCTDCYPKKWWNFV